MKDSVKMEYDVKIEELGEINYLAINNFLSMADGSDAYADGIKILEQNLKNGSIDRLKSICNTDVVYILFCNTYDPITKMCSNDFACINNTKIMASEFQTITIRKSKYAALSSICKFPMTLMQANVQLDDIFWKEWLPKTNYKCVIDYDWNEGSAAIGLNVPLSIDAKEFTIKIWYPIEEK
jgi:hypothetical protein